MATRTDKIAGAGARQLSRIERTIEGVFDSCDTPMCLTITDIFSNGGQGFVDLLHLLDFDPDAMGTRPRRKTVEPWYAHDRVLLAALSDPSLHSFHDQASLLAEALTADGQAVWVSLPGYPHQLLLAYEECAEVGATVRIDHYGELRVYEVLGALSQFGGHAFLMVKRMDTSSSTV